MDIHRCQKLAIYVKLLHLRFEDNTNYCWCNCGVLPNMNTPFGGFTFWQVRQFRGKKHNCVPNLTPKQRKHVKKFRWKSSLETFQKGNSQHSEDRVPAVLNITDQTPGNFTTFGNHPSFWSHWNWCVTQVLYRKLRLPLEILCSIIIYLSVVMLRYRAILPQSEEASCCN